MSNWEGSLGFLSLLIKSLALQRTAPDTEGRFYHDPWKGSIVAVVLVSLRPKEKEIIFIAHSGSSAVWTQN
jgi:hypothetical protein